ncbi:SRPBCC family protein [Microlunatus spumicola]|uniref:SRPBCC family protein n=1 Tax=Microlunatus spumicola TaxID=81499 RepID=A0ABP6WDV5_9ACTN
MQSRHLSVVIRRPPFEVYDFAAEPDNLVRWAAGLASADVHREGAALVAASPMGPVRIVFVERNAYGVLDHDVTTPDGVTTHNPLRVLAHPDGAEVVFTLRQLAMTDDELDRDAGLVRADLERLRDLLEA